MSVYLTRDDFSNENRKKIDDIFYEQPQLPHTQKLSNFVDI